MVQVREEITHLLALRPRGARQRVARDAAMELPAHGDSEAAGVQEAVIGPAAEAF